MTPASVQPLQRSQLAGRGVVYLENGATFEGWLTLSSEMLTIDGRVRVSTGPSHSPVYTYRSEVKQTFPVRAIRRIDWAEASR